MNTDQSPTQTEWNSLSEKARQCICMIAQLDSDRKDSLIREQTPELPKRMGLIPQQEMYTKYPGLRKGWVGVYGYLDQLATERERGSVALWVEGTGNNRSRWDYTGWSGGCVSVLAIKLGSKIAIKNGISKLTEDYK